MKKLSFPINSRVENIHPIRYGEIKCAFKSNKSQSDFHYKFRPGVNILLNPQKSLIGEALAATNFAQSKLFRTLINCTISGKVLINNKEINIKRVRKETGVNDKIYLENHQINTQQEILAQIAQLANVYQMKDLRQSLGFSAFNQGMFCDLGSIGESDFPNLINWECKQYLFESQLLRFELYKLDFLVS